MVTLACPRVTGMTDGAVSFVMQPARNASGSSKIAWKVRIMTGKAKQGKPAAQPRVYWAANNYGGFAPIRFAVRDFCFHFIVATA
jgi:hypothetical protein